MARSLLQSCHIVCDALYFSSVSRWCEKAEAPYEDILGKDMLPKIFFAAPT